MMKKMLNHLSKQGNTIGVLKGITLFTLGIGCVIFGVRAFVIEPMTPNAIMYIKSIFLTHEGTNTSATGIMLDGDQGDGRFKSSVTIDSLRNIPCVGTNENGTLTTGNCLSYTGVGTKGATGAKGDQGDMGPVGPRGATGADGADGATGAMGVTGYSIIVNVGTASIAQCPNSSGIVLGFYQDVDYSNDYSDGDDLILDTVVCNGADGVNGQDGVDGEDGADGATGTTGITGHSIVANITSASIEECQNNSGLIFSFYLDENDNYDYDETDRLLVDGIVCNGQNGAPGIPGLTGATGADGTSITDITITSGVISITTSGANGTQLWTGLVGSVGTGTLPICTTGEILKYSGTGWLCSTVVASLPTCTNGYILKSNGSSWSCAVDNTGGSSTSLWIDAGLYMYPSQRSKWKVGIGFDTQPNANLQVSGTFIAGDVTNSILNSTDSSIGGGNGNTIDKSNNGFIAGGMGNTLDGSQNSVIVGGMGNILYNGSNNGLIAGSNNTIFSGSDNGFIAGSNNTIADSSSFSFIAGLNNTITHALNGFIIGSNNAIFSSSDNGFIAGSGNTIYESSPFSSIGGGINNIIYTGANHGFIGGGEKNTIYGNTDNGFIAGGSGNMISGATSNGFIAGGSDNMITKGHNSFVAGHKAIVESANTFVRNSDDVGFSSARANTFLINAPHTYNSGNNEHFGGVGINTNDPRADLEINSVVRLTPRTNEPFECTTGHKGAIYYKEDNTPNTTEYLQICKCSTDGAGVQTCIWDNVW